LTRMSFSNKGGRVRSNVVRDKAASGKSPEDVVRDIKTEMQKSPGKDYRERSLAIHGLVCARCAREFNEATRHLLTVHHKDGNHENNPADGSNWENLCVYCHDDAHSRGLLGDYLGGSSSERERVQVYGTEKGTSGEKRELGILGEKLLKAIKKKNGT